MYKNTPKLQNKAAKLTALLCLLSGAALFMLSTANLISLPWLAQISGIILLTAAIYIASVYLLRQYTFIIEKSNIENDDGYDFVITERKNNRDVTVCRLGTEEIISVRVVTPQNKKAVEKERKSMSRYMYDTQFAPSRQIEIVSVYDGEKLSILITYDENLLEILNDNIKK